MPSHLGPRSFWITASLMMLLPPVEPCHCPKESADTELCWEPEKDHPLSYVPPTSPWSHIPKGTPTLYDHRLDPTSGSIRRVEFLFLKVWVSRANRKRMRRTAWSCTNAARRHPGNAQKIVFGLRVAWRFTVLKSLASALSTPTHLLKSLDFIKETPSPYHFYQQK